MIRAMQDAQEWDVCILGGGATGLGAAVDAASRGYRTILFEKYDFEGVLHCAAESHVDRSITDPLSFVKTNVLGTMTLLQAAKDHWKENMNGKIFYPKI